MYICIIRNVNEAKGHWIEAGNLVAVNTAYFDDNADDMRTYKRVYVLYKCGVCGLSTTRICY